MSPIWSRLLKRVLLSFQTGSKKPNRRRLNSTGRGRLGFEVLEDRLVPSSGTWVDLTTNVSAGWGMPLLLPNGDVLLQTSTNGSQSNTWYILAPGPDGSFSDGTLTKTAPMGLARLAFGSCVLTNGDVM